MKRVSEKHKQIIHDFAKTLRKHKYIGLERLSELVKQQFPVRKKK